MASNFKLRRFSNPATLKSISPPLLVEFLRPFQVDLARQRFICNESVAIDYDALAAILMAPGEDMPDSLLDALFFVDEMSLPGFYDDLMTEAQAAGVDLGSTDEISTADLAVRIWLADPNILERMHAERFLIKPKSFQSFLSTSSHLPDIYHPADAVLEALQQDLNDWFETKKRGRGTRVFPFFRDDGVWFLVRHGQPYRREGTIRDNESSSVYYRPEKFDVLIYNPQLGELAIHASTKGEKKAYCKLFGRHFFGNEMMFDGDRLDGKYTLDPIIENWGDCVVCSDVEGIDDVRLAELQFRHNSAIYHVEIQRADDVFAAMEEIERSIPAGAKLLKASFKVTFRGAVRPRTVVIRPPNIAIFDRESDNELLTDWLTKRKFIVAPPQEMTESSESTHADTEAVLAVP